MAAGAGVPGGAEPSGPQAPGKGRRPPRWAVNVLALPGLLVSMAVGAMVVPWHTVYGARLEEDGHELDGLGYVAVALLAGFVGWLLCWVALPFRPRAPWRVLVVITLLTPAVVLNGYVLAETRRQVCEIRAHPDPDAVGLHDVPWPLAVHCGP